jgi:hypothetical protein
MASRGCSGRGGEGAQRDAVRVHGRRAFDAQFAPIDRASARLLATARGLGYAPVHGHIGRFDADEAIVGFQRYFAQSVHRPDLDPLVAPLAKRGGRALLVGDPLVGAAEHQDLHELLEDHPVRYAGPLTAQRMIHLPFWKQGTELLPDGLDEVWWERGDGFSPSSGSLLTPRMIERPAPAFQVDLSRPYPRSLLDAPCRALRNTRGRWCEGLRASGRNKVKAGPRWDAVEARARPSKRTETDLSGHSKSAP